MKDIQEALNTALEDARLAIPEGNVATYIPDLGKVDKNLLGACVRTMDGTMYKAGDTTHRFTIQSISKIISLAAALHYAGENDVFEKVGMEPSGESFNSLVELDLNSNRPYNPMINSGAITVASILAPYVTFDDMLVLVRKLCMDPDIVLDKEVYHSEMNTASRNMAIAYLLESKGILASSVERSVKFYTKMCSLSVTAESLANLALVLANGGVDPLTGNRLLDGDIVRLTKTIMLTCGMYDGSGTFAAQVGIPTKSGVGGGMLAVASHKMGIGLFGPSLDEKGNSIAGQRFLRCFSKDLNLHMFAE